MWIQRRDILMLFEGCLRCDKVHSRRCLRSSNGHDDASSILEGSTDTSVNVSGSVLLTDSHTKCAIRDTDIPISTSMDAQYGQELSATSNDDASLYSSHIVRYLFDVFVLRDICTYLLIEPDNIH